MVSSRLQGSSMTLDELSERITRKYIAIKEVEIILRDHLASAPQPAGRARLREALAVAEHIANRGGTSSDWNELVHYIDVANLAVKSDAS